jgi:hypothetical protein
VWKAEEGMYGRRVSDDVWDDEGGMCGMMKEG